MRFYGCRAACVAAGAAAPPGAHLQQHLPQLHRQPVPASHRCVLSHWCAAVFSSYSEPVRPLLCHPPSTSLALGYCGGMVQLTATEISLTPKN